MGKFNRLAVDRRRWRFRRTNLMVLYLVELNCRLVNETKRCLSPCFHRMPVIDRAREEVFLSDVIIGTEAIISRKVETSNCT